uniref:Protein kinase domain-containing protein n=1 Tax=Amphora coffeiformis TaxID=265554 RepID=A0A7S3L4X3_9STRA|mmetsp:Transcript_22384/g.42513  ORF Transcript_22384/g.42513 Transcript_22384/m.42513 type:complete len:478 (+) Transcript_22384:123-1556(+)
MTAIAVDPATVLTTIKSKDLPSTSSSISSSIGNKRNALLWDEVSQCLDVRIFRGDSTTNNACSTLVPPRLLPSITANDVQVGHLLGEGGFSEVFGCSPHPSWKAKHIRGDEEQNPSSTTTTKTATTRDKSTVNATSKSTNKKSTRTVHHQYALKKLRADLEHHHIKQQLQQQQQHGSHNDPEDAVENAIRGAYFEATLLSHIPHHAHIIRFTALSEDFWQDPRHGFVVMEKLTSTLDQHLDRWHILSQTAQQQPKGRAMFPFRKSRRGGSSSLMQEEQLERIESTALGVAHACLFLHQHGIVHRDVKPTNIGFSSDSGAVKLFDFGLARTTHACDGQHRVLTGNTGTPCYMAPEVAAYKDYGPAADVFSFAILLWEICALEPPPLSLSPPPPSSSPHGQGGPTKSLHKIISRHWRQGRRPSLRKIAAIPVRRLLPQCWHHDPSQRPTFEEIVPQLVDMTTTTTSSDAATANESTSSV